MLVKVFDLYFYECEKKSVSDTNIHMLFYNILLPLKRLVRFYVLLIKYDQYIIKI